MISDIKGFVLGTSDGAVTLTPNWKPGNGGVRLEVDCGAPGEAPYVSLLSMLVEACEIAAATSQKEHANYEALNDMHKYLRRLAYYFELRADEAFAAFKSEELKGEIL